MTGQVIGVCHLCGAYGPLSFEHVPPRAAFNDRPVVYKELQALLGQDARDFASAAGGRIQQRGAGAYTLCGKCNSDTGGWYGRAYVEWAEQGLRYAYLSRESQRIEFPYGIYPLRIIKEILCMFFSSGHQQFREAQSDLVRLVLNKTSTSRLPNGIRLFAYHTLSPLSRKTGVVGQGNVQTGGLQVFSEVSHPPWGYVLGLGGTPPDPRLLEISGFSTFRYDDRAVIGLRPALLPVESYLPGDYRTKDQLAADRRQNEAMAREAMTQ